MSRSRSRNRSRSRSRSPRDRSPSPDGKTTFSVTEADAAFVRGKNGKTKDRIGKVTGCRIFIDHDKLSVEINGPAAARKKCKKYMHYVMTQRNGPVHIAPEDDDGDLTTVRIPQKACGFVTGKQGNFLRSIEEEWNSLMFFTDVDKSKSRDKQYETLAIWGDLRGRRASELKVLNAAEYMVNGYFEELKDEVIARNRGEGPCGTWGTDHVLYDDSKVSYALGKQGSTRKKIEVASGAIVQYVGKLGLYSGTAVQRKRATDYMKFLFGQLEGPIYIDGWEDRDDCRVCKVPTDIIPYVTGPKRAALSSIEDKYGVFMLFMNKDGKLRDDKRESEQLIIFGAERGRRAAELKILHEIEWKKPKTLSPDIREYRSNKDGFDVDIIEISGKEINYLIGKKGSTMIKIEKAVGCFLIYIGNFAHICGDRKERGRCTDYIQWLLKQLKGPVTVRDAKSRTDCTEVWVPKGLTGRIMGAQGAELRKIEAETGVFSFMAVNEDGDERLCIFATDPGSDTRNTGRMAAEKMIKENIARFERGGRRDDSRSPRRRSNSRPRQRAHSDSRPRRRTPPRQARGRDDSRAPPPRRRDDSRAPPPRRRDDSRAPPPRRRDDYSPPPRRADSRNRGRR